MANVLDNLTNEEVLQKAFMTGEFPSGDGLLNPKQQKEFIVMMKRLNVLFGITQMKRMTQPVEELDKMFFFEPVTRPAGECTFTPGDNGPTNNKVKLDAQKISSFWEICWETLQSNIEQRGFESTVMNSMVQRIGLDLEILAIQGDEAITVTPGNKLELLLSSNDGWYKKSLSGHVLDVGGASVSRDIFREMLRMLPKQYRNDPELRFFMSDSMFIDYIDLLAGGNSFAADAGAVGSDSIAAAAYAGGQGAMSPYGKRIVRVPLFPDDLPVTVPIASGYASLDGAANGPFRLKAGDTIVISTDLVAPTAIVLTTIDAHLDLVTVASIINASLGTSGSAYDNGEGQLRIRSSTDGAGSSVTVGTLGAGSTANEGLGYATTGASVAPLAGLTTTVSEGGFIWLCNPKNLVWGMLDKTRLYSEYNKNFDQIETVVYNQVDFEIANIDAMVVATGVRRSDFP